METVDRVCGKSQTVPHTSIAPVPCGTAEQVGTLIGVVLPFLGVAVAVYGLWGWGVSWWALALLIVMYTGTGLGITIGYHRLFTHRSFECYGPVKYTLAVLGSMAVQGPLFRWVGTHRRHHQHSDSPGDPHSPHRFGSGARSIIAGWWHAHVGWIIGPKYADFDSYVRDLKRDRNLRLVDRMFGVWVALGLIIPTVIGGLVTGTWSGAALGLLWGGLVRVFLVHHVTWSINSVCHLWGTRPFHGADESRNNALFGVLAFGEGWHNNHHAFPTSARHGLRWWQLDSSYWIIRVLQAMGLAWRVRVPSHASILRRQVRDRTLGEATHPEKRVPIALQTALDELQTSEVTN